MSLTDSLTYFISLALLFLRFGRRICHAIIMILVGITFLMFLLVYKGKRFEPLTYTVSVPFDCNRFLLNSVIGMFHCIPVIKLSRTQSVAHYLHSTDHRPFAKTAAIKLFFCSYSK